MRRTENWTWWHLLYGPAKMLDGLITTCLLGRYILDFSFAFQVARRIAINYRKRNIIF